MSTIAAILEPDPDGTLHLPVPAAIFLRLHPVHHAWSLRTTSRHAQAGEST